MSKRSVVLLLFCVVVGCTPRTDGGDPKPGDPSEPVPEDPVVVEPEPDSPPTTTPTDEPAPTVMDDAFRIDLSEIDVTLDVVPDTAFDGHAELVFTMRPGQVRPLFHFDPDVRSGTPLDTIQVIQLDGEELDPTDEADVRLIQFDSSPEEAYELQRDLEKDVAHTLVVEWSLPGGYLASYEGWLHSTVDDTVGRGNEVLWPTINAPEELARHRIEVRIDDPREYVMIGSGTITSSADGPIQVWSLDTEREISSYTVMMAAVPLEDVAVEQFDAGSVPVTIVSTEGSVATRQAVDLTRDVIAELEADFGPFPMPSMQILLIDWPDGMEYYGATTTGLSSLSHEIVHMYWGCSAVNRTWRDTWMDEAVNVWWEFRANLPTLPDDFTSDMVSGRTEIQPGFDPRAYAQGALIFGEVATAMGGDAELITFLADLHDRRAFAPFTTDDLVDDVILATGEQGLRADFDRWLKTP